MGLYNAKINKIVLLPVYESIKCLGKINIIEINNKFGIVDNYGIVVQNTEIDSIFSPNNREKIDSYLFSHSNYGIIVKNGKSALIDLTGKEIGNLWFDEIPKQLELYKFIGKINGKYGVFNIYGKIQIPFKYQNLEFNHNYITFKKDKYWGILDTLGNIIESAKYLKIDHLSKNNNISVLTKQKKLKNYDINCKKEKDYNFEKLVINNYDDKKIVRCSFGKFYGYFDLNGKVIKSPSYKNLPENLNNDEIFVIQDEEGKCGLMNNKLVQIIPNEYDTIIDANFEFDNDKRFFWIIKDSDWGAVNEMGKILIPCIYDYPFIETDWYNAENSCIFPYENPIIMQCNDGKMILFDFEKGIISPPKSNIICKATEIFDSLVYVISFENGTYSFLNDTGAILFPAFSTTIPLAINDTCFLVKQNGKFGICNFKGEMIISPSEFNSSIISKTVLALHKNKKIVSKINDIDSINISDEIFYKLILLVYNQKNIFPASELDSVAIDFLNNSVEYPYGYGYDYCGNDACIRNIEEKYDKLEENACWPPGYGTFEDFDVTLSRMTEDLYEISEHIYTYGHGSGDETYFKYYQIKADTTIELKMEDFFVNTEKFWTTISKITADIIEKDNLEIELDCTKDGKIINENTSISLDNEGLNCWLYLDGKYMEPLVFIKYEQLQEFINQKGIINDIQKSKYIKQ